MMKKLKRWLKKILLVALLLSLGLWLVFPLKIKKAFIQDRPNIVLITMDTTTFNHLSCYGYQRTKTTNIDRLANEGIVFENSFTPVALTQPTHATLFTGTHPIHHGVRYNLLFRLPDHYQTLAETLKAEGYQTGAVVGSYILDKQFNLNQGFDFYEDEFNPKVEDSKKNPTITELITPKPQKQQAIERSAKKVVDLATQWIEKQQSSFFLWTHFFDAHTPYLSHPQYIDHADNPYDQEILAIDEQIGRLYNYLQQKKLLENTLIVFTTDHGEGLGHKGESQHGFFLHDQTIHTALIFHYPKRFYPKRVSQLVTHLDFLPTLLEFLKIPFSETTIQGKSYYDALLGHPIESRELLCEATLPKFTHGWALIEGVRNEEWKYIFAPQEELYHLASDPYEIKNLAQDKKFLEKLTSMRVRYQDLKKKLENKNASLEQVAIDSEHMDKMLSLGYFWGPTGETGATTGDSKDPKEMIEVYRLIEWARYLSQRANNESTIVSLIAALEAILMEDPKNQWSLHQLARQLVRVGRYQEAERKFNAILRLNANQVEIYGELAHIFLLQGKFSEAERQIETFLELKKKQKKTDTSQIKSTSNSNQKQTQELAQAYLLQAEIFYRQKKYLPAKKSCELFLAIWPGTAKVRNSIKARIKELEEKLAAEKKK